jgi:hypothetical protein
VCKKVVNREISTGGGTSHTQILPQGWGQETSGVRGQAGRSAGLTQGGTGREAICLLSFSLLLRFTELAHYNIFLPSNITNRVTGRTLSCPGRRWTLPAGGRNFRRQVYDVVPPPAIDGLSLICLRGVLPGVFRGGSCRPQLLS